MVLLETFIKVPPNWFLLTIKNNSVINVSEYRVQWIYLHNLILTEIARVFQIVYSNLVTKSEYLFPGYSKTNDI